MNTNEQTPPKLPLCVAYEEAKNEIFDAINRTMRTYNVPLFLYEIILKEAHRQMQSGANNERQTSKETYDKQLAEYEKQETGG